MPDPPTDYNICPCCGTEFGNHDEFKTHEQLRYEWVLAGAKWFFRDAPPFWSAAAQLSGGVYLHGYSPATFGQTVSNYGGPVVLVGSSVFRFVDQPLSDFAREVPYASILTDREGVGQENTSPHRASMVETEFALAS
jgi:hypothetical protein